MKNRFLNRVNNLTLKFVTVVCLLFSICIEVKSQNLDKTLKELFFYSNLNTKTYDLKSFFDTLKQLTYTLDTTRVKFNLESDSNIITPVYLFYKHNIFKFKYDKGKLNLGGFKANSGFIIFYLSIYLIFKTKVEQLIAYKSIKTYLANYPYKKTVLNDYCCLSEEIKFQNTGKLGGLSLSKGMVNGEFYVYIYNLRMNF